MTASVSENPYRIDFTYGPDNQRIKSVLKNNGATIKTKYFSPGYEKEVTTSGTREITYINSPYGLVAVDIRRNGTDSLYYVESDHLGSIIGLVRADGTYRERYSYDAWGRRRIPKNWSYDTIPAARVIDRGFTGHEHLDEFKLINMNGRMYDPVVARFLGVDPVIQYGDNSQSYNGYSYCLNNPLKYSDPTGYNVYQIKKEYWAKVLAQGDLFNLDDLGQEYGDILGGNSRNDTNMPDVSGVSTYLQSDLKIQIISLGKGQPTIIATTTINPRNGEWGSKIELVIRVFGEGYSEYNFVQSFFNNFPQSKTDKNTWQIDGDNDNGFFYCERMTDYYSKPYWRGGSQAFFRDVPNDENDFHAEWTLCGYNNHCWDAIGTFSWGYSIINGQVYPCFNQIDNPIQEHIINVNSTLEYYNLHH